MRVADVDVLRRRPFARLGIVSGLFAARPRFEMFQADSH